jgi:hypothetical protein
MLGWQLIFQGKTHKCLPQVEVGGLHVDPGLTALGFGA